MKIVKECQDQEKASDEDVQAFRNHRITPSGKCLVACVNEKIGGVSQHFIHLFCPFLFQLKFAEMEIYL